MLLKVKQEKMLAPSGDIICGRPFGCSAYQASKVN